MALNFPSNPTNGQTYGAYVYDATVGIWRSSSAGQGIVSTTTSAPTTAVSGDMWFNPNDGTMYVYYNDGTSGQWVESRAPITADGYQSPNYIINGGFDIWQRGTSQASAGYGSADRWYLETGSAARDTGISGISAYSMRVTHTSAQNGAIQNRVELPVVGNAGDFAIGSVWTVSYYAKRSVGTAPAAIFAGFIDAGGPNEVAIAYNTSLGTITTSWQRFSHTFTVSASPGASSASVKVVPFANLSSVNGDTYFTGVQLERGSVATPFRRNANSIQSELAACQRYYETGSTKIYIGITGATGSYGVISTAYKVSKRATPTITTTTTTSRAYVPTGFEWNDLDSFGSYRNDRPEVAFVWTSSAEL